MFDSSLKPGRTPLEFGLGLGQVIKGWDRGLLGMCIGEKRKLTIPPHLAYGSGGAGSAIPPDSTLVFTTELIGIKGYDPEEEAKAKAKEEKKEAVKAEKEPEDLPEPETVKGADEKAAPAKETPKSAGKASAEPEEDVGAEATGESRDEL